jgi:L-amino acid N-acyltransferase YncA
MIVREATPDDAEAVVGILNPIIESRAYTALDTPFSVEAERQFIVQFPVRGIFHVAVRESDGRMVGFQTLDPFAAYTRAFDHVGVIGTYVADGNRRQGVARQLFAATFDAALRKGYEKIFTFVRADNETALRAYLAQGFAIIGTARKHARIDGRYVDEILIEKMLIGEAKDGSWTASSSS